jgi:hypothetical protein
MSEVTSLIAEVRTDLEEKFYLISTDVDDIELAQKLAKSVLKDIYNTQITWNNEFIKACDSRIKELEATPNPHNRHDVILYNHFKGLNNGGLAAYKARRNTHIGEVEELKNKISLIDLI